MAKKKRGGVNSDWMATYSDLVTLLFCFFVLLYSMSSMDKGKFEMIVQSFNPAQIEKIDELLTDMEEGGFDGEDLQVEGMGEFDDLYYTLQSVVEENGIEDQVEVIGGEGYTFITFRSNVFFDGNKYTLKEEGKSVLDGFANAIGGVSGSIQELQVLGHTSQASPNIVNEVESDRFLSSNRAAEVLVYLQKKNIIDPSKLISSGYGQFRPISSFDTTESRAKNRRVEILITKNGGAEKQLDQYYREVYGDQVIKTP